MARSSNQMPGPLYISSGALFTAHWKDQSGVADQNIKDTGMGPPVVVAFRMFVAIWPVRKIFMHWLLLNINFKPANVQCHESFEPEVVSTISSDVKTRNNHLGPNSLSK
jgi:hypothetical protein